MVNIINGSDFRGDSIGLISDNSQYNVWFTNYGPYTQRAMILGVTFLVITHYNRS